MHASLPGGLVARVLVFGGLVGSLAALPQDRPPAPPEQRAVAAPTVRFGRAVDVYGWRQGAGSHVIEPHARAVVVGPTAIATLPAGCSLLPVNPDSGRKRILIAAEIGSAAFESTLQQLQASVVELADVVPKDAAFVVTWPATGAADDRIELIDARSGVVVPLESTPRADGLVLDPVAASVATGARPSRVFGMPESPLQLRIRRRGVDVAVSFRVQGLLPDPEPPRLIGEMTVYLEQVARLDDDMRIVTLFFGGIRHAVDRGDVLRILDPATRLPIAGCEVLADVPRAGIEGARRAHVRVRCVRDAAGEDVLERLDPSRLPGFPSVGGAAREAFVRAQAPKVTLVSLFEPEHGDDAANFVRIDEREVADTDGNREDVPPRAGFQVRFSTPVDPATLSGLRLLGADADPAFQVAARTFLLDASERAFRVQAPLGLPMTPQQRQAIRADREKPAPQRRPSFVLEVVDGPDGVKSRAGALLAGGLQFGFVLDPEAADNVVGWRVFAGGR